MNRVLITVLVLSLFCLIGCSQQQATAPAQPENANAQAAASPSASPIVGAMSVAPTLAMPSGSPIPPPPGSKQAKGEQRPLPPAIWERMTRPLTLEEINNLPPETRDMILEAQGRKPKKSEPQKK